MAKRKRQQDIKMRITEGRGSGIGKEYVSWIKIKDVSFTY
ncbi:hypothetical protein SAMN02745134_03024 [Clostridium acidisoli DSM 12555]|uniref:Uncharacterized protein n=1 Tax=Clostridium acidisoli DSM 12555 TaxID=1121291 RepID=A0A1W1XST4_9CLOT|nr:hypothetical protein SAMN02745134_03024 [Clostridium acidisoli DSM 12555]